MYLFGSSINLFITFLTIVIRYHLNKKNCIDRFPKILSRNRDPVADLENHEYSNFGRVKKVLKQMMKL